MAAKPCRTRLRNGDLIKGFNAISDTHMTYPQIRQTMKHPVACIYCHDPATMQLRITRPAFIEGIGALKASQGIQNYDVNTMATRQEIGGTVGGPVRSNRVFFFAGYDQHIFHMPTVVNFLSGGNVLIPQAGYGGLNHGDFEDYDKTLVFATAAQLNQLAGNYRSELLGNTGF